MFEETSQEDRTQRILNNIVSEAESIIQSTANEVSRYGNSSRSHIPALEVKIFENYVSTTLNNIQKDISLEDFKVIFDGLFEAQNSNMEIVSLPFGCFAFGRSINTIELSCYYPGVKRMIKYQPAGTSSATDFNIPFPNVIVSHVLELDNKLWSVKKTKYFATTKTVSQLPEVIITERDSSNGIYLLPFTNVYDDARLCYGNNTMPVKFANNLRGLDYYFQMLSIAPFNNDLGIKGITNYGSPAAWYEELSKMETFPYERFKKN